MGYTCEYKNMIILYLNWMINPAWLCNIYYVTIKYIWAISKNVYFEWPSKGLNSKFVLIMVKFDKM